MTSRVMMTTHFLKMPPHPTSSLVERTGFIHVLGHVPSAKVSTFYSSWVMTDPILALWLRIKTGSGSSTSRYFWDLAFFKVIIVPNSPLFHLGTCEWLPAEDDYDYRYVDPSIERKDGENVLPGSYNVEAYCLDDDTVLVGGGFVARLKTSVFFSF